MSIDEKNVFDFISTTSEGQIQLTISDHYSWDENLHLQLLQDKINAYLHFIQSGQILKGYPNSIGKKLIIQITMKNDPDSQGYSFLENVQKNMKEENIIFQWNILKK